MATGSTEKKQKMIGLFTEASINGYRNIHDYYEVIRKQIILGDQLGYDFYTTTQSYGLDWPDSTFSVTPDPVALFASCAAQTSRIKLMTGIIPAAFHHPAITVSNIASLDQITNGRAMLGVGRGHPWLFDRLGLDQGTSRDMLSDLCMFTRRILDNQDARHTIKGKCWSTKDFQLLPPFVNRDMEVYVAVTGSSESAAEAASHGFGVLIPAYVGLPMEMAEAGIAAYNKAYQKAWGTDGRFMLGVQLYAHPDNQRAVEMGANALAGQFKVFSRCMLEHSASAGGNYPAYKDIGGFMAQLADVNRCKETILNEWPRYMAIWGDGERCVSKITELIHRLKPSGIIFNVDSGGIPFSEIDAVMRYAAVAVLPSIRKVLAEY
jgi:alkanesulfonate monooxygenase SsuD/methylene tetrahydromethanopterin reductase-like flavin-dependent oxidoreductase (luciferase family)